MTVHRSHHHAAPRTPGLTAADKRGNAVIATALKAGPLAEGGADQAAVKWLERMLSLAGFKVGTANNHFGAGTTAALKQFQASVGLPATGQLDAKTFAKLETVELRVRQHGKDEFFGAGQAGKQVQDAEKRLKLLGYDVGAVDGVFDQKLGAAIKAFRADQKELPDNRTALSAGVDKSIRHEVNATHHDVYRARAKKTGQRVRLDALTGKQAAAAGGIKQGQKGRAVANVQAHLRAAGFDPKHTGGAFDERTTAMVEAFQRKAGLPATGVVDARTWARLQGSIMLAKNGTSPAQRLNERSHEVHHTENLLHKLGYKHVQSDGLFDAHTQSAVRAFEKKHHLHVDGQVSAHDLKVMEKAVKEQSGSALGRKIVETAMKEVGRLEDGANGGGARKYQSFFGRGREAWCADFVSWVYTHAGKKMNNPFCPSVVSSLKASHHWKGRSNPQPGDMVLFDWDHDGVADHIGIVKRNLGGGMVETIEGNTSDPRGSGREGVFVKRRPMSDILGFGSP